MSKTIITNVILIALILVYSIVTGDYTYIIFIGQCISNIFTRTSIDTSRDKIKLLLDDLLKPKE